MRARAAALASALTLVLLAGCDSTSGEIEIEPSGPPAQPHDASPPGTPDPTILPTRVGDPGLLARVADGVIPPTNRWYSGLVFGDQPFAAFPRPLSFVSTNGGFAWGVPQVTAGPDAIVGPASHAVTVQVDGAQGLPTATATGPVGVSLAYGDAEVTLAGGSPVISIEAVDDLSLTVSPAPTQVGDGLWTMADADRTYGIIGPGSEVEGATLTMAAGESVQMFAVPDGGNIEGAAAAITAPLGEVDVAYEVSEIEATTTLAYASEGESTLVAVPSDREVAAECELGTYPSVNGTLKACRASAVSWTVPTVEPALSHDLAEVAPERRDVIVAALEKEAELEPEFPHDTYFGSKALHRHALLVTTADALGETVLADHFADELAEELQVWAEPDGCERRNSRCFEYHDHIQGVVGLETAFGSEEFNDHHFHYGYLLNAAAIAMERDPSLGSALGPVMDLVAADIASVPGTAGFPQMRAFDPFAGHSWASGFAPFGDGNNQESSSEAVLAWNGVAVWAQVRENSELTEMSQWMLSAEADTAVTRWLRPDLAEFEGYEHDIVAIIWGGKREYSTWFSDETSAILGIELIPMAPVQRHLAPQNEADADTVLRSIEAAAPSGFEGPLADYLLMYQALAGPDQAADAWDQAMVLPDSAIDNGNSRPAMLAWIAALE